MQSETEVVANAPQIQSVSSGKHRAIRAWLVGVIAFLAAAGIVVLALVALFLPCCAGPI